MRADLHREEMMIRDRRKGVPSRGLLLGTCTSVAEQSGVAAPLVRAATIVALCLWFKLALLLYCGGALYYRFRR